VRTGDLKGKRFAIQVPIANIGRAEYNDVVIADGSVSTSHAKLQRREGIWVLVDLDSTNGTRVDGEGLRGEAPLAPGAKIQFGNVEVLFEPTDDSASVQEGGGTQLIDKLPLPEPPPTRPAQAPPEPDPPTPRELEGPAPEWSVVAQPSEPTDERAEPDSQLFTRLVWGLLVLVVLAVLIIVFAG
jgi:pSer/pThr/pTyr-binding forkhead associated (FHA) protein